MDITQFENRKVEVSENRANSRHGKKRNVRPVSATVANNPPFNSGSKFMNVSFADQQGDNTMPRESYKQSSIKLPPHPQSAKMQRPMHYDGENDYLIGKNYSNKASVHKFTPPPQIGGKNTILARNLMDAAENVTSLKKLMPKSIKQGKEALYEGALIVKEKCNKLENENTKLRTQVHQLEKQNIKIQKLLYEIEESQANGQITFLSQPAADSLLILTLKKEQKFLQETLKYKDEEIQKMKASSKHTRVAELEIQLEKQIEAYLALKIKLDFLVREKNRTEGFVNSNNNITSQSIYSSPYEQLRSENVELKSKLIQLEDKLDIQDAKQEVEGRLYNRSKEFNRLQDQIQQQQQIILQQTNQINQLSEQLRVSQFRLTEMQSSEDKNKNNKQNERQLLKKIEEKENLNQALQDQLTKLQEDFAEASKKSENERQRITKERNSYKQIAEEKLQKFSERRESARQNNIEEVEEKNKPNGGSGYVRTLLEVEREKELYERKNMKRISYQQVIPVSSEQIEEARSMLKCKLTQMKISLDEVLSKFIFTPQIESKGFITIEQLIEIFCNKPFEVSEKDSEYLARFLIEDNSQDVIKFKKTLEADNSLVRSRVKFLIGKVRVFSEEEEEILFQELANIQRRSGDAIYSQLQLNTSVKDTLMATREQVVRAIEYLDLNLTKDQTEYYFMKLFQRSNKPNKFNLDDCCKLFVTLQQHE